MRRSANRLHPSADASQRAPTVVVVNDSPDQLGLMVLLLQEAGYHVSTAMDGHAGVALAERVHPDVIISDVVMPHLDGFELCRRVRSVPELALTPILLVSAISTDTLSAAVGLKSGADDYLEVPYDPVRLVAKVARLAERKSAEEILRRQLDLTAAITESLGEGVLAFDMDRRLTFMNPAAERALGWSLIDRLTEDIQFVLASPHADRATFEGLGAPLTTAIGSGSILRTGAARFVRRDGTIFPVSYTCSPIRTGDATAGGVLTFHDVTDAAEAEGRLRAKEAELREAQRLAQVGSWTWLVEPDIVTWSDELFRIFGRDPALGAPSFAAQKPMFAGNAEALFAALKRTSATAEPYEVEFEIVRADGQHRWIIGRGEAVVDHTGAVASLRGTVHDVTELHEQKQMRERASQKLEASERRYRDLVENLNDVVFSLDTDGTIRYVSPSIQKYGYDPQILTGQHFSTFIHADDRDGAEDSLQRAADGAVETSEFRVLKRDGKARYVRASCRAMFDEGRLTGVTGVVVDVTEQRHAEEKARGSQRLEAVGRLAGGIAHDFNNLLVAIIGYTEFAIDGLRKEDPMRHDLEEVLKAGNRAAALTHQLLAFSRKQVLKPQVIDLNDVLKGMEAMLRRVIGEDIDFVTVCGEGLGLVLADPGQIEQVIMNLVVNARDAMPLGGRLVVETSSEAPAPADPPSGPAGVEWVVVTVTDTGCGMDDATRAVIFEPFFSTKDPGKGTGLGLATVHGIVNQSGGVVTVDTAVGQGTRFRVAFPRVTVSRLPVPPAPASARATRGKETILLVEDEAAVCELTKRSLAAEGYRVLTARNGDEALLICGRHAGEIDLLLTDVVMPGMSGRILGDRLTAITPGLRVLYMSGYGGSAIAEHGVLTERMHVIEKPFTRVVLASRVREVLEESD